MPSMRTRIRPIEQPAKTRAYILELLIPHNQIIPSHTTHDISPPSRRNGHAPTLAQPAALITNRHPKDLAL
jgi:hypothetical protein